MTLWLSIFDQECMEKQKYILWPAEGLLLRDPITLKSAEELGHETDPNLLDKR